MKIDLYTYINRRFIYVCSMVCLGIAFVLGISVVRSGYYYQFDGDELLHAQKAFLLSNGQVPFRDYFSIYTPIFHWLIAPTIVYFGATFHTLRILRIEMIFWYIAELVFSVLLLRNVFGWRVAMVFLGLIAIDPFTTFAGMQIRPDTLMMTLFVMGAYGVSVASSRNRKIDWIIAGVLLGLSVLTAIKILPATIPVICVMVYRLITRHERLRLALFLGGIFMPAVIFAVYFMYVGLFTQMTMQLFVDVLYLSRSIQNPIRFGNFYIPDNIYLFGQSGAPLRWVFVLVLPVLACMGAITKLWRMYRSGFKSRSSDHVVVALVLGMVCTFIGLFIPTTVFIQYYVPLSWFFCLFAAFSIVIFSESYIFPSRRYVGYFGLTLIYLCFVGSAVNGNNLRAEMGSFELEKQLYFRWNQIPVNAYVFPNYVFRPIVYPLGLYQMGDMPEEVRRQFIRPEVALEKFKVRYIILNEPGLAAYDRSTVDYIHRNYVRDPKDEHFMTRLTGR